MFYGLDSEYTAVAVVGLGKKDAGYNDLEEVEEGRENVRNGVAGTCTVKHVVILLSCLSI